MRLGHPALALCLLIVISLACGPAGASLTEPTPAAPSVSTPSAVASTATVEGATAEALDLEDLPPASLEDLLEAKVADAGWTQEVALLAGLRVLAGQTGVVDAFGAIPFDAEGSGVVYQALNYLQSGADPAVKTEIEDLLAIILPPPERLLQYAQPEAQTFRPPGLMAARSSEADCTKIYEKGFPEGTPLLCLEYKEQNLGSYKGRVFYPNWWTESSPEWPYLEAAHQAVAASWNLYTTFGEMRAIDLVFTVLGAQDHPTALAVAPGVGGGQSCQIAIFPAAIQIDMAKNPSYSPGLEHGVFMQIVAHEMFHCFQAIQFPEHAWDQTNWGVNDWWGESTAEFFSNLVYPNVNYEWRWRDHFAGKSTSTSLFDMSYDNFLFFQYLGDPGMIGPEAILALISGLPPGSLALQRQALSQYPDISELWHEFGQAVVDQSILDTGGKPIVLKDHWTDIEMILKTETFDLSQPDFVLARYRLSLGGGLGFHVHVDETDVEVLHTARPADGGQWLPLAIDRDTGCAHYVVVVTSAGAETQPRTFELGGVVDQPATAGAVCDACVVGRWRMTHTSYMNMYNAVMSEAGEAAPFSTGTSGDLFLDIHDDGTLDAEAASFGVTAIGGIPDIQGDPLYTESTMALNGTTSMNYLALDGELVMEVVDQGIAMKFTVSIMGEEFEMPLGDATGAGFGAGGPGTFHPFNYVCTPKQNLTLAPLLHPELYKGNVWDFVWVGP